MKEVKELLRVRSRFLEYCNGYCGETLRSERCQMDPRYA